MAEVFEPGVASSARPKAESGATGAAAHSGLQQRTIDPAQDRPAPATWSSSLGAKDLACLMAVIETQLLPTLLRSYRPAERAPLKGSGLA